MNRRSDDPEQAEQLREKIIGLGERSFRKSYYPQLQQQLVELQRFRALLDQSSDAVFLISAPSGRLVDVNESACRQLLRSRETLLTLSLSDITDRESLGPVEALLTGPGEEAEPGIALDTVLVKSNGEALPVEITVRRVAFGGRSYAVAAARDISERKRAEALIRETVRRQEAILNSIPDMAWLKGRDNRYIAVNEAFGRAASRKPADVAGLTDLDIWPAKAAKKFMDDDAEIMRSGKQLVVEETLTDRNGNVTWYETIKTPIYDERGVIAGTTGIARDITHRKKMEETIKYQAHHDLLTGLPNKMLFMDHLELELSQARRMHTGLAVLFLDLDRFKNINDGLGHTAGDTLLKQVAARLAAGLRDTDTIARIGGDEFTIVLPDIARAEDAAKIVQKLQADFRDDYIVNGHRLRVTASVGISVYPVDGEHPETLLKNADIAMYQAKDMGRNNYQFFNPAINVRTLERITFENMLHRTIEREELEVYYQPLLDVATHRIVWAEALVRWRHPELGLLDPVRFIPLAEETGFIVPIDEWVLETACRQNRLLQDKRRIPIGISVNLSSGQFQNSNLWQVIARVLNETGLDPKFLGIEITESTAMKDTEFTVRNLSRLTDMGIRFSIDDFGTGYSSMSYLKRMPLQKLKIDKSFISGLGNDSDYEAIVNAMIAMAHSLKLRVIAEGVETKDQFSFLRRRGCDEIQGFLVSPPLPASKFEKLILSGSNSWNDRAPRG